MWPGLWERVLQADRAIDRWATEASKSKSSAAVAVLEVVLDIAVLRAILCETSIGRRVSYSIVSSSIRADRLLKGAQTCHKTASIPQTAAALATQKH